MLEAGTSKAETEGRELMKPEYGFELVPEYKDIFTCLLYTSRRIDCHTTDLRHNSR